MRFRRHLEAAQQSTRRLLLLFAFVVLGLLVAVNLVLALIYWVTFPFTNGLPAYFIQTNSALVLLFVLGGCYVESMRMAKGGPHVAEMAGARLARTSGHDEDARRERRFANVVQEMALASGQRPVPQAWVLARDDSINALATGWGPDDAVVVVTRGALERLTRAELQGVVAHEFSHIVHGDTRLNMRLVGLVFGLHLIWSLGLSLWSEDEHGRRGAGALFGLGLMAVGSLGWLAGRLLQAAVSRQREFLADASAVKYARHVDGLGRALRKIADQQARRVRGFSGAHAASLAHLLLSSSSPAGGSWRALLATHPPLAQRLARLYGHAFEPSALPLSADPVPLEGMDVEALTASSLAPSASIATQAIAAATLIHRAALGSAHDATQNPAFHDKAEREREALARISRWQGPGEWQAAMLALSIDRGAHDSATRWNAYQAVTADLTVGRSVRADIEALGAAQRRRVFERLLAYGSDAAPAQRRRLASQWSARWREMEGTSRHAAPQAWRALVIHSGLQRSGASGRGNLTTHAGAVQAATRLIVRTFGVTAEQERAWHSRAVSALQEMGMPAPRGSTAGLAPILPAREWLLALRVRRLAPMQRPLLVRAWIEAARSTNLLAQASTADALHLVCVVLDIPVPEALLE